MARYAKALPHLKEEELSKMLKKQQGFWRTQQILVILSAMKGKTTAKKISEHVNLSVHHIRKIISTYNKQGATFFESKGQGGRKYGYMSVEEEKAFLKECEQKALEGKYTTVSDIKASFEQKVAKTVARSTIHYLLKRHNWRKLTPRPSHPKKDKEKQALFKKTLLIK